VLLCGATACFAQSQPNFPVGTWYAEEQRDNEVIYSIVRYSEDGLFRVSFRECVDGKSRDHEESGTWIFDRGQLSTRTDHIYGKPVSLTALYTIVASDKNTWTATVTGGDALRYFGPSSFKEVLVVPASELPGCTTNS
jgi:hypothetical protein